MKLFFVALVAAAIFAPPSSAFVVPSRQGAIYNHQSPLFMVKSDPQSSATGAVDIADEPATEDSEKKTKKQKRRDKKNQKDRNGAAQQQEDVAVAQEEEIAVEDIAEKVEQVAEELADVAKAVEEVAAQVEEQVEEELTEQDLFDIEQMHHAIQMAQSAGGERGAAGPYPKPIAGAVIVTKDGTILGRGRSDYNQDAVRAAIADAGIDATPLSEWVVSWPSSRQLREALAESTLYVTLEPSAVRHGEALPPQTQLIEQSGIPRVVIGCPDPIPERAMEGASALHSAGLEVSMGVELEDCEHLIEQYAELANSKLQVQARKHAQRFGRPLGFLHCSVVDSDDAAAFARHGNAFGKTFGGKHLSYRDFGSYELAPPPELVWAADTAEDDDFETELDDDFDFDVDFEEEDFQDRLGRSPMMPW